MLRNNSGPPKKGLVQIRLILLLLLLTWSVSIVSAKELSDSLVHQRISFLEKSLNSDQKGTKQWWYGWLGGYGALTVGQGVVFFSSDDDRARQDMALGATTTFIGVLGQFISPFQPTSFADRLSSLPESNESERLIKMSQMEKLLVDRSLLETEARNWKVHILPTSINLVSGLVTWLGFHRTVWDGVANFAYNCVITESQIWSQPIRASRALKRYREQLGYQDLTLYPPGKFNCKLIVSANGAGLRVTF